MPAEDADIDDGQVPFADRRFNRDQMIEVTAPSELAELIEREISRSGVAVPADDFLEIRCASENFATAVFMIKRGSGNELRMLVPSGATRKPN